jgi:CheY-like chemotaxis protein
MTKRVNCVLLVDDNHDDNYFHKRVIEKSGKVELVTVVEDGVEALEYLKNKGKYTDLTANPRPNIIFLDINMPRMNGFEFLEKYQLLDEDRKADICVTMLSTSRNPDDINNALSVPDVSTFFTKPLDERALNEAVQQFFDKIQ